VIAISGLNVVLPQIMENDRQAWMRTSAVLEAQNQLESFRAGVRGPKIGRHDFEPSSPLKDLKKLPQCFYEAKTNRGLMEVTVHVVWGKEPGKRVELTSLLRASGK